MKKYFINILLLIISISLVSCNDWLDISPKSEIKVSDNFLNEQGYKDALTGVYLLMTNKTLYGRDLSYGMVDVLGKYYTQIQSSNDYYYLSNFDYTNQKSINIIDGVWKSAYNALANINILISNIESSDPTLFTANNKNLIRGEAYGLRAFLYFDLLRLFGPSFVLGENENAIPYVSKYGKELTKFSTVNEVINLILADLQVAENELKHDPVYEQRGAESDDQAWVRNRELKFNFYAVKLLQARVLLYKRDYQSALSAAQILIDQDRFTWTPSNQITTTTVDSRNRIFSHEMIFGLHLSTLKDDFSSWFTSTSGFYKSSTYWEQTFETSIAGYSADYRYEYLTFYDPASNVRYSTKLQQPESNMPEYARKLPLMRFTEAYYIAAECKFYLSGVADAVPFLNIVRGKRNIMVDLNTSITSEQFKNELLKEYIKEFSSEGQLFYFYKRNNYSSIKFYTGTITPEKYKLPIPLDELANR